MSMLTPPPGADDTQDERPNESVMKSDVIDVAKGEQAIITELIGRKWVKRSQLDSVRVAIEQGQIQGPIHKALLVQRLITPNQFQELDEFIDKDLVIDGFQVIRKLGSGAMGDVYLAVDPKTEKRVALKVISKRFAEDEQFLKRFGREIAALQELRHPAIAGAVAQGTHDALPYLAMEYVDGPSLTQLLNEHGPLPETFVIRIMKQIAAGLEYVFKATNLVHRDIKPENILAIPKEGEERNDLYNRHDTAMLIDFGLARSFESDERLTMTGVTMGTPHYMSPEQIKGSQSLDVRSDIYALGATALHLLTGRPPYQETSPGAVMTAHLTEPVPDPKQMVPSLSEGTRNLIRTCMAKSADQRYKDCNALVMACENALNELSGHSNQSGMRLLRKPLVLNNQVKRSQSDRYKKKAANSEDGELVADSGSRLAAARDRIKEQSGVHRKLDSNNAAALAFPDINDVAPIAPDAGSLTASTTERIQHSQHSPLSSPEKPTPSRRHSSTGAMSHASSGSHPRAPRTPLKPRPQSALDRELDSPGLGPGPIIVLAVAAVLAIAAIVWMMVK